MRSIFKTLLLAVLPALALALHNGASSAAPQCSAADIPASALAPPGGLPTDWVGQLSPYMLYFQVLADFAYQKNMGGVLQRKDVAPCLKAWGAKDVKRVSTTSPLGADVNAMAVRTDNDIIIVFRGMDSRRDVEFMDTQTKPVFDAAYYGDKAVAFAATNTKKNLDDGTPNTDAFWVLDGYTASYQSIHDDITNIIASWEKEMPNKTPGIWFVGHSDGSQLAQLAALKYATSKDAARVGGVVLFGPSRVGSRGFANFFNSVLGGKMVYYYYGRDPASTSDYTVKQGLWFPGVGLAACPINGAAYEKLVKIPVNGDGPNVCTDLKQQSTFLSSLWLPDFVFDTSDPMIDSLSNWEYLAHHIPAITYDGLMRMLVSGQGTARPNNCTLAALGLSECVVSAKCSAALRPAGADKCRGCATDETCSAYWGISGGRCDRANSELSGWMCYQFVPGTQLQLFYDRNGALLNPLETLPVMPRFAETVTSRRNPLTPNSRRVGK